MFLQIFLQISIQGNQKSQDRNLKKELEKIGWSSCLEKSFKNKYFYVYNKKSTHKSISTKCEDISKLSYWHL